MEATLAAALAQLDALQSILSCREIYITGKIPGCPYDGGVITPSHLAKAKIPFLLVSPLQRRHLVEKTKFLYLI